MQVQFLRDHLGSKAGDVVELTDAQANYLIRVKAAQAVAEIFSDEPGTEVNVEAVTGNAFLEDAGYLEQQAEPEKATPSHTPKNKNAGPKRKPIIKKGK